MSASPPRSGKIAIVLGFLLGTWTLLDGLHRFIAGDYVRWHGHMDSWTRLVSAAGLNPTDFGGVLVAMGILWLVIANLYLFQNTLATWKAMAVLLVLSSWYIGPATVLLIVQLAFLLAARRHVRA